MSNPPHLTRRNFLIRSGILSAAVLSLGPARILAKKDEEEVSPAEDLMREHGLLNRVMLIYDAALDRLKKGEDFPPEALLNAAGTIRSFIENYHEKLEEDHLFPRFEKAHRLADLVAILRRQHQAGRRITESIQNLARASTLKSSSDREHLTENLHLFVRMYRPHEAREDTILFPELHEIISKNEYDSLGEDFERKEHQLFGRDGFEGMVQKVAEIEKGLGLYDLAQFTPRT